MGGGGEREKYIGKVRARERESNRETEGEKRWGTEKK